MKRSVAAFLAVALLLCLPKSFAAPRQRRGPALGREISLPEGGIRLRVPAGTEIRLLPPPVVYATCKSDGTALYRARDIWMHVQTVAIWDGRGVSATLTRVEYPPEADPKKLCMLSDYRRSRQSYRQIPDPGRISVWAGSFFNVPVSGMTPTSIRGDLKWFELETAARHDALFFGHGTDGGELRMFMLRIDWSKAGGANDREWGRLAERCAASAALIPRRKIAGSESGSYAERLAQAKKSISGLRGWYIRETPNYIFLSNQRNRSDMRRLQSDLEAARELFKRYFPPARDRCNVGVVKLFAERGEYLRYVGSDMKWTAGVWRSGERELVVSPLGVKVDDRIAERYLREVALHEGFHQYIFYAANEINPPLWLNEGCAQFFQTSLPRQGEAGVLDKETETKLAQAARAADSDLSRFLKLDHAGFYAPEHRDHNYALSHALCYYLLRGAPAAGESRFAAIPGRYLEALARSRNLKAAHEAAFSGIDTRELAAKLKQFWSDKRRIQRAKRYRGTP